MYKIAVPYIDQSVCYPTGCESVSAVMLLQYLGYTVTVDQFIEHYLERREFEIRDGQLFGPDPNLYFAGSPYDTDSFGCYAPVIEAALEKAAGDKFRFVNETGADIEVLIKKYIDCGMPVVLWACINMREPVTGPSWKLADTGEEFVWISNEHCMLLVGYDEEHYYFNDPYENNGVIGYRKEVVEDRYQAQHCQAVAAKQI